MNRTIKVTGKSNIKASPDYTRISIDLSDVFSEYDMCLAKSVDDKNIILDSIQDLGFERKDLKTSDFEIIRKTEEYRDDNNNWKCRFIGYQYNQSLSITFKNDNKRLGKILYALAHLPIKPEINISYFCNDTKKVKSKLLSLAIKDAKQKALLLAGEAGVKLCEVLDIDYSYINVSYETEYMKFCLPMSFEDTSSSKEYDVDFEPDDISAVDVVRITFRIE